jgi:hypothetical protein
VGCCSLLAELRRHVDDDQQCVMVMLFRSFGFDCPMPIFDCLRPKL